jgi:hypothetical protein
MQNTEPFIQLGGTIDRILSDHPLIVNELTRLAQAGNPWFTEENVRLALQAIAEKMLRREKLEPWFAKYPYPADFKQKNVGIILAGNLPLVGFFDLLCVCVSGHNAYIKMSSKDRVLMQYVIRFLRQTDRPPVILPLTDSSPIDAMIATGSDNTNRYFRERYRHIPHLLRGSRTSIAVLTGRESEADLLGLSHDVFDHFGMGCRSVGKIFVPEGYEVEILFNALRKRNITHSGYRNAYRHHKAVLHMRGTNFRDGGFFTLRENEGFSEALPDLMYTRYQVLDEVREWIKLNDNTLQCVVTNSLTPPRHVGFGQAQWPELSDYPDGRDVMDFLRAI